MNNCDFYNFFVCQKEKFQGAAVTVLCFFVFFSSNCKVQLAPHVRDGSANLKDEDLAQANDASESSFFTYDALTFRETVF